MDRLKMSVAETLSEKDKWLLGSTRVIADPAHGTAHITTYRLVNGQVIPQHNVISFNEAKNKYPLLVNTPAP